jgi:hypothetical protein
MALGSGSSLATGFWMRRKGFPSSDQLLKVGKASRPPALITEAHGPGVGVGLGHLHQSVASEFASLYFFRRGDREM